ncbi:MAG: DUF177 domain-containing protein [Polyangiaceae bacterium]
MEPLFQVSVHDIDAGGLARSFELPLAWLEHALEETDITAKEPGSANVRLSRTGHDVVVRGTVSATLEMPCARCLAATTHELTGEMSLVLRPARSEHGRGHGAAKSGGHGAAKSAANGAAGAGTKEGGKRGAKAAGSANGSQRRSREPDEYEFSSEEADEDVYDGETVVLDELLREALLLEAPSFPLCSEDCPGIRPAARTTSRREEPIDPRLSPLRALKTKLMLAGGPAPSDPGSPEGEAPAGAPRERPARTAAPPRPRLQAHRTKGSLGSKGASKKVRAKTTENSRKKAK